MGLLVSDQELIEAIEERAGGVAGAHSVLGVSESAWYRYRSAGILSAALKCSIEAHLMLPKYVLKALAVERAA